MVLPSAHLWMHGLQAKPCYQARDCTVKLWRPWHSRLFVTCHCCNGPSPDHTDIDQVEAPSTDNEPKEEHVHARPIASDDTGYGPRGLLLAGFSQADAEAAAAWMQEMEPGFSVSHATDDMMSELLATALYDPDTQELRMEEWQQTTTLMPRICLMSGLSGAEQVAVAEAWEDYAGSAVPCFAAAVPNSLDQPLRAVLQAVVDEHARHAEDDPRLQPANVMANVDSERLKAMITKKIERGMRKKEERQAKKDAKPTTAARGFG